MPPQPFGKPNVLIHSSSQRQPCPPALSSSRRPWSVDTPFPQNVPCEENFPYNKETFEKVEALISILSPRQAVTIYL